MAWECAWIFLFSCSGTVAVAAVVISQDAGKSSLFCLAPNIEKRQQLVRSNHTEDENTSHKYNSALWAAWFTVSDWFSFAV